MDHFCPWVRHPHGHELCCNNVSIVQVANNIGFFNYKFFYLTIFYGAADTLYAAMAMFPTGRQNPHVRLQTAFL